VFVSYPTPGKHLAFDGDLLHGCPAELVADQDFGVRRTMMVNVWIGHHPLGIHALPVDGERGGGDEREGDDEGNSGNLFALRNLVDFEAMEVSRGAAVQPLAEHSELLTPKMPLAALRTAATMRGLHAIEVRYPHTPPGVTGGY
jgi:hypothetical protein